MRHTALLLLTVAATASAATPPIAPKEGKWEITTQMPAMPKIANLPPEAAEQMKKIGMKLDSAAGSITTTICLNKANQQQWQSLGDKQKQNHPEHKCDAPKSTLDGNKLTVDVQCSKPKSSMHAEYQFSPGRDSYTFNQTVQVEKQPAQRIQGKARRVGDC